MLNLVKLIYNKSKARRHSSFMHMNIYLLIKTIKKYPFLWLVRYIYNISLSYSISYKLHGLSIAPKVIFDGPVFPVNIIKSKNGSIHTNAKFSFIFQSFLGGNSKTVISINNYATLKVDNPFYIGNGVKLIIEHGAVLHIKGSCQSVSGITCDTIIFTFKEIFIGADSLISWGVYISDSTQHQINGILKIEGISIGNNVWISEGVTISPATIIGDGSIVGSKAYLNSAYPNQSLIVGIPGKIKKRGIMWIR